MAYKLGERAKAAIRQSTGCTFGELDAMGLEEEFSLVESIRGAAPVFDARLDERLTPRGSLYLGEGRYLNSDEVENALDRMYLAYA